MDRDLNEVRGIFLRALVDNPGSVNTDLADIEQFFCRMQHFPRIAVRYEELASCLLACTALVSFLWLA